MKLLGALTSSAVFHVASMVNGLATVPLFLSAFGRENYGFWAALLGTTAYLSLLNFGVAQTVSSGASRAARDDAAAVPRLIGFGFRFYLRVGVVALPTAIVVGLACPWAAWFGLDASRDVESRLTAAAVFGSFIVELPFSVLRAALYGAGEVTQERLLGVGAIVLRVAAAAVFAVTQPALWLGVLVLSAINLTSAVAAFALLQRRFPALWSSLRAPRSAEQVVEAAAMRPQSVNYFVLQIAGAIVWSTDALLTGFMLGAGAAAEVSAAWRVISIVLSLGGVVVPAVAPTLARVWAEGDTARSVALATDTAQVVFALLLAGTLGAAAAGEAIFALWLGPDMFAGRGAWLAYCLIVVVQAMLVVPEAFVTQTGRHSAYARATLVEAAIKLALSLALMRAFGLIGLPLGTLIGRCTTTFWIVLRSFGEATGQSWGRWLARVIRPSVIPAVGFVVVFGCGRWVIGEGSASTVFALGTASGVVYVVLYALTGLPDAVRARLMRSRT